MTNEIEILAKIYFFRKFNQSPIPGYDQINIVAFSKEQAYNSLSELVKNPEQFYFDHVIDFMIGQ